MRGIVLALALGACGRIDFATFAAPGDARTVDVVGTGDAVDASAPSGLIGWWKLDETGGTSVADSVGTASGMLTPGSSSMLPTWTTGMFGGALHFTGDGDNADLGTPAAAANLSALSISGWIRVTAVDALSYRRCVLDKGSGTAGWTFTFDDLVAGDVAFHSFVGATQVSRSSTGGMITAGVWTHLVVTWDGSLTSTGIRLYVDGAEVPYGSGTITSGPRPDDSAIELALNCAANDSFAGDLDDVKLFDRVLSPTDVAGLSGP